MPLPSSLRTHAGRRARTRQAMATLFGTATLKRNIIRIKRQPEVGGETPRARPAARRRPGPPALRPARAPILAPARRSPAGPHKGREGRRGARAGRAAPAPVRRSAVSVRSYRPLRLQLLIHAAAGRWPHHHTGRTHAAVRWIRLLGPPGHRLYGPWAWNHGHHRHARLTGLTHS